MAALNFARMGHGSTAGNLETRQRVIQMLVHDGRYAYDKSQESAYGIVADTGLKEATGEIDSLQETLDFLDSLAVKNNPQHEDDGKPVSNEGGFQESTNGNEDSEDNEKKLVLEITRNLVERSRNFLNEQRKKKPPVSGLAVESDAVLKAFNVASKARMLLVENKPHTETLLEGHRELRMPAIAILAWGSLVWEPKGLAVSGQWKKDGPLLPIEFARISEDQRLTLVLYQGARSVPTLWARSALTDLRQAISNLSQRERTDDKKIGFVSLSDEDSRCNVIPSLSKEISQWAESMRFDAVIWTDLPSNHQEKGLGELNEENVITYMNRLPKKVRKDAEKYVRMAPNQIETTIRNSLRQKLGWDNLSDI